MANLPSLYRETPVSVITPIIPLNFVYPGLSLAQIVAIVWAYRKLTALIIVVVVALAVTTMALWPRTYTAMVTMMVNYEVNDPLNGKELPVGQMNSYIATQIELMQTPELMLAVVDRLRLTEDPNYIQGYNGTSGTLHEWVAAQLRKTLAIYRGQQGSQLIYITYSADDRAEAALIANTVADIYKEQDHLRSTGPPSERTKRYGEQLNELKSKVDQAQQDVTAFHQRNGLINQGDAANVDMVLLASLEERLLEAQNSRRGADARASGDQSVSDQVLASTEVQKLKSQLADQQQRLTQLNFSYTPQHPEVVAMQSLMDTTRRSLANAQRSYAANAAAELSASQRLEQNMQRGVKEQRSRVLATGQLQDEAAKYLLELQSAQTVYKRALEGYDQIMFASSGHYTNVTLVSRASPPVKASKPRVLAGLAMGFIAAGCLGFGIPLLYELFNRRVRCRDDIERHHGIAVLMEFDKSTMRAAA
jgi:succinoglycan biosynthesis transport protein ExoP